MILDSVRNSLTKTIFAGKLRKGLILVRKNLLFSLCFPPSRRDSGRTDKGLRNFT